MSVRAALVRMADSVKTWLEALSVSVNPDILVPFVKWTLMNVPLDHAGTTEPVVMVLTATTVAVLLAFKVLFYLVIFRAGNH